jgi:uncharacterized protein (DUF427 family)
MSLDTVTIKNRFTGEVLASAKKLEGVRLFEGAWYFDPETVDMSHLVVTKRTYTCPYKGICYWINLEMADYKAEDVAFVYFKVSPCYEFVKDRIGFYAGVREGTIEE